ncbi:peptidase M14 [Palleronia sp. LCG004]|uniref:peptidase M14 n=1 Tax=Palleronia sp. LCG004 TaxID=3079304 RepID=UPI002941F874|nr:peptidase M14 [Palleronia sp. LCG004]WOI57130.1 peptidase M14 [Palleronia sp. LCG004]
MHIDETYPRTINSLPEGATEVWLFESLPARRAAEARGGPRVRSAYKTLLHDVMEDGLLDGATRATIHYPVVDGCPEDRFRLECYPLHELHEWCEIAFAPRAHEGDGLPEYVVETDLATHRVRVPVRWVEDASGGRILAACGWASGAGDAHLPTEYEAIFGRACAAMADLPLDPLNADEPDGPFFDRLEIDATVPAGDLTLPVGHECISLAEALHEDIYFASLEIFRHRLGLGPEERSVKSGQVVPRIVTGDEPRLSMRLVDGTADADAPGASPALDDATHWLTPGEIAAHLGAIGGTRYEARSRQGRAVPGTYVAGRGQAMLAISAGQHANESSPMVGALRAGRDLAKTGRVSFTLNPLENPDGYAVFRDLCRAQPRHMHHAARYTASGADLSHGQGRFESAIRDIARDHLRAKVHVNLHGYPSHEWTRPLSGYIPHGFGQWTIPKGFFLILRHDPDEAELAARVLGAGLAALAEFPELVAQNRRMLALYDSYVSGRSFDVYADAIPYTIREEADPGYPVTLITEAPDETIGGEDFRIAQEGQYRVVMAVARALGTGHA